MVDYAVNNAGDGTHAPDILGCTAERDRDTPPLLHLLQGARTMPTGCRLPWKLASKHSRAVLKITAPSRGTRRELVASLF